jgi:hypothetical protein
MLICQIYKELDNNVSKIIITIIRYHFTTKLSYNTPTLHQANLHNKQSSQRNSPPPPSSQPPPPSPPPSP